ncbi:MAG: hypothetical protein R6U56_04070, partial [Opitutales bacterium]
NPDFKLVEFDQFKIRIIQLLPETKQIDRATAAQPIFDDVRRCIRIPELCYVRERDKILSGNSLHPNCLAQNGDQIVRGVLCRGGDLSAVVFAEAAFADSIPRYT